MSFLLACLILFLTLIAACYEHHAYTKTKLPNLIMVCAKCLSTKVLNER